MRLRDPVHPPGRLHNNLQSAINDLAYNLPAEITHDRYAFGIDPLSTGNRISDSINVILGNVRSFRTACDSYSPDDNIPLWFMGQCSGNPARRSENADRPPYDRRGGRRILTPNLFLMQNWLAIAEGARGLFLFSYNTKGPQQETYWGAGPQPGGSIRDWNWQKTAQWKDVRDAFGDVKPLTYFLPLLQRDEENDDTITVPSPLITRSFKRRDITLTNDYQYAVVVNTSESDDVSLSSLTGPSVPVIWDVKHNQAASAITLQPGEGTVLWFGDQAQASDDQARLITVPDVPDIELTSPADGSVFFPPTNVLLEATVNDGDHTVIKVEFYDDTNKIGEVDTFPYSYVWSNPSARTHTLTVVEHYDGGSFTSPAITIRINASPTVNITSPLDGTVTDQTQMPITVSTSDDSAIARVEFYDNDNLLGDLASEPYTYSWSEVPVGYHVLTAVDMTTTVLRLFLRPSTCTSPRVVG